MAGEPARALVTDQITSSFAIPDEDDSRRAIAVTAAVAAAIPAAIEGVLNGAVRRNELSLVVKHRLQTELITALDKATKDACAPFTMDGAIHSLSLDTCLWREIRYFSHTYQYRFWMLLECNAALNRRISLGKKKI